MRVVLASTWTKQQGTHASTFARVVKGNPNADLIAFPGWTLTPACFKEANARLGGLGSLKPLLLWELETDRAKDGAALRSNTNGDATGHGRQRIKSSTAEPLQMADLARNIASGKEPRWIAVAGRELCWLNCGEIFLLECRGPQGHKVARPRPHVKTDFEIIYRRAGIFFNPTHTLMSRWQDKNDAQAKFLSAGGRVFLRVSNVTDRSKYSDTAFHGTCMMAYRDGHALRPKSLKVICDGNNEPLCMVGVFEF